MCLMKHGKESTLYILTEDTTRVVNNKKMKYFWTSVRGSFHGVLLYYSLIITIVCIRGGGLQLTTNRSALESRPGVRQLRLFSMRPRMRVFLFWTEFSTQNDQDKLDNSIVRNEDVADFVHY